MTQTWMIEQMEEKGAEVMTAAMNHPYAALVFALGWIRTWLDEGGSDDLTRFLSIITGADAALTEAWEASGVLLYTDWLYETEMAR